ncbi:rhodanese-related sulfurtransferase [Pelotomaculum thermopropionicum SI]|uniref:Sulfurtransferase n=1 Tax=Pelotomaculum thermopropionicum (strain DSM 13744 / JCM 10971 / SI) TaxID=370438 RepID=A5D3B0_PELTS|nr:rhodanese-related sulfurtransferase [Pelotomaculum thermopropionicum SI]
MNKRSLTLLIYILASVFVFVAVVGAVATYSRHRSWKAVRPAAKSPAALAAEKISQYNKPQTLISVYELHDIMNDPNVLIVDTRGRSFQVFRTTYQVEHIPGAVPVLHSEYTHPVYFGRIGIPLLIQNNLSKKGFDNKKRIVLYGNDGLQGRFYWMLKMYGCDNQVQILDGGIEKWKEAGFPVTGQVAPLTPSRFEFNSLKAYPNVYTVMEEVVEAVLNPSPDKIIVDTRPRNEFLVGHIPYSVNISFTDLLNQDGTFKPARELAAIFNGKGVTPDKTVFVYSKDGVQSSLLWFVLHELLGYPNVKNYDGGFSEWHFRERVKEFGEERPVAKAAN